MDVHAYIGTRLHRAWSTTFDVVDPHGADKTQAKEWTMLAVTMPATRRVITSSTRGEGVRGRQGCAGERRS